MARMRFHTGVTLAAVALASNVALGQAKAGAQINDGAFPPGFDCSTLDAPNARLECRTFQAQRAPDTNAVAPGTPAFPMPGRSNSTSGPYVGPNPGPLDFLPGKRRAHGE